MKRMISNVRSFRSFCLLFINFRAICFLLYLVMICESGYSTIRWKPIVDCSLRIKKTNRRKKSIDLLVWSVWLLIGLLYNDQWFYCSIEYRVDILIVLRLWHSTKCKLRIPQIVWLNIKCIDFVTTCYRLESLIKECFFFVVLCATTLHLRQLFSCVVDYGKNAFVCW